MEDDIEATLDRQGDSLVLPIPLEAQRRLGLAEGDKVDVSFDESSLVVKPAEKEPTTLEELWGNHPPAYIELEIKGVVGNEGSD